MEEEDQRTEDITLGFLEEATDKSEYESPAMPSKAGGLPAWLALDKLPSLEDLECPECHIPMMFLLQLNSPLDDVNPDAYYRTLYVFCCKSCIKFRAFRCQLPQENPYYLEQKVENEEVEDDEEEEECPINVIKDDAPRAQLCDVCGFLGSKTCARCHKAHYCTQFHQKIAWQGGHSRECASLASGAATERVECDCSAVRFPERLIVSEDEPSAAEAASKGVTDEELEEKIKRAQHVKAEANETAEDEAPEYVDMEFLNFQRRLERAPQQVLRYIHGNVGCDSDDDAAAAVVVEPLWCSEKNKPTSIPPCPLCGGRRVAEFQLTPQIIYLEGVSPDSSFDFGTVVVYTCAKTCSIPVGSKSLYAEEFVFCQQPNK